MSLLKVLTRYAARKGLSTLAVEGECTELFQSAAWKRHIAVEQVALAQREIDTWPEWKRKLIKRELSRPYVEPEDRGNDANAKW